MYDNEVRVSKDADERIRLWRHRLSRGIKRRKKEMDRWKLNKAFEDLKQHPAPGGRTRRGSADEVTINKVGSFLRDHCASIAFKNPRAVVRPRNADGWAKVSIPVTDRDTGEQGVRYLARYELRENLLNYFLGHPSFGFAQCLRRLARAGQLTYGIGKVGFTAQFKDLPDDRDISVPVGADGLPDFSGFETETDPDTGEKKLILDDDEKPIPIDADPIHEEWFCDPVQAEHMIIDPDGGPDFFQHKWVAQIILMPLGEVKRDRNFKNTDDIGGTGWEWDGESENWLDRANDSAETEDPDLEKYSKIVRLFEIYDFVDERLIVLADGHDKFLRDVPIPEGIAHSPYAFFRPQEIDGEFYPRPPVSDAAPINSLINLLATAELKSARRSAVHKTFGRKLADTKVKAELESMDDTHSELDTTEPINDFIQAVPKQPFPSEMQAFGQKLDRWFDEVMGQSGEARGVASSKTATQSHNLEQHSVIRVEDQRNLLAATARELINKLNDSLFNMTIEQAITIEGTDGQLFNANVSPAMIVGDYDVDVDITDMAPIDPGAEAAKFDRGLTVVAQAPWMIAEEKAAEVILGKYGIKDRAAIQALVRLAQMQMQAQMGPPVQNGNQPEKPGPSPENPAEAMAMAGGEQGGFR